jgi:hypothetical protein
MVPENVLSSEDYQDDEREGEGKSAASSLEGPIGGTDY